MRPKLSNNFCIGPAESIFIKGQSPRPFNLLIFFIWKLKDVKEEKEEGLRKGRRKDIKEEVRRFCIVERKQKGCQGRKYADSVF